jgi:hypothetical protein
MLPCGSTYLPLITDSSKTPLTCIHTSILLTLNYILLPTLPTNNVYNMSDLPKYSRSGFDTSETESLVKSDRRGSLDGPAPSYPPTAGSSSNGLANITYSFIPQWPVPGKRTNVLGVLGRNTEVSTHTSILCATYTDELGNN